MTKVPPSFPVVGVVLAALIALSGCGEGADGASAQASNGPERSMRTVVTCMEERGWNATYDESDGSMEVEGVPDSQRAQNKADHDECMAAAGMDAPPPPLDDDQLAQLYAHELETAECLRGFGVDVAEAPSEQVFEDTYNSGGAWSAYASVGQVDEKAWQQYERACPQLPEGW